MRLKSLELQGYKTFAARTLFDLSAAITAVVGPNGSGKSNIADCIRWVLGEQSYSLLRAKKTEDMIFSGSESRPRLGLASATITFDNADGWLPIDFSEVAVTRRAYRDGDNEYLINGQRVRLKDVGELLAQSGLAERTYMVIGQGVVDAVLSLRADERRRLFEEAAGIGLYRSRREDAVRRLDATRRNLERVQDILSELEPRLRSLERQAKRAREYAQALQDMGELLRQWYGFHWHRAQGELVQAREAFIAQENRLAEARQGQLDLGGKETELRSGIRSLREDLGLRHVELAKSHTERESILRQLAVNEERQRLLLEQEQASRSDWSDLSIEISQAQDGLQMLIADVLAAQAELGDARVEFGSAQEALAARSSQRARVESQFAQLESSLGESLNRRMQLQALLSSSQKSTERLENALGLAITALEAGQIRQGEAESQLQILVQKAQSAENDYTEASRSLALQRQRLVEGEGQRNKALEVNSTLQNKLEGLRTQLEVLEQAETSLTGYTSGTQTLLQAATAGELTGVIGAVSQNLQVPAELEIPIAAAMGDFLDAVLLSGDPDAALDLLVANKSRGALLPLRDLKPDRHRAQMGEAPPGEVIGRAAALIGFPPELLPAVELLLGDVWIVRSRRAAQSLASSQPGGIRWVSLSGEVFHASGQINIFGGDHQPGQTILSRARRQREIKSQVAGLEEELVTASRSLQSLEASLAEMRQIESDLDQRSRSLQVEWQTCAEASRRGQLDFERARTQVESFLEDRHRLQDEIDRAAAETEKYTAELNQVDQSIQVGRRSLNQVKAELEDLSLVEDQAQVTYWSTQVALAEQQVASAQERQIDRQGQLEKQVQSQGALAARLEDLGAVLTEVRSAIEHLHQLEVEIDERIQGQGSQIQPLEIQLAALEEELAGLQLLEAAARQKLSLAEHQFAQTRITLDRRQEAVDSLRRRIEDDFGLVAFEYAEGISGPTPLPLQGMIEKLENVAALSPGIDEAIHRQRSLVRRLGPVNTEAQVEYEQVHERFTFLTEQMADLRKAEGDVRQVITELDELMEREFGRVFQNVAVEFKDIFTRLFGGGQAQLVLTDPEDLTGTGIDIVARLPGRRTQGLALLSGGERSLTAAALVFALLRVSPTPFCVLDEVDAMLDEVNVGRFSELLRELSLNTQIIIITHNRNTVQVADVIYGVTMGRDSTSHVLSLKLDAVKELVD